MDPEEVYQSLGNEVVADLVSEAVLSVGGVATRSVVLDDLEVLLFVLVAESAKELRALMKPSRLAEIEPSATLAEAFTGAWSQAERRAARSCGDNLLLIDADPDSIRNLRDMLDGLVGD